jgi:menaquinone-specific isochorismate synthase
VVLARAIDALAQAPIDPRWLLRHLAAEYPDCWSFAVDGLIGATPELLVRSERGLVQSRVLAGTIQRTGDAALDAALSRNLAGSAKDLAEHDFAVQSLAQALIPHCASMSVPPKPFILQLANVLHLASDISAVLADLPGGVAPSVLELVAALHPTAAVGGTPTAAATRLIAELEGLDRGRYAGPVGWIDSDLEGEWGIALGCGFSRVAALWPSPIQ